MVHTRAWYGRGKRSEYSLLADNISTDSTFKGVAPGATKRVQWLTPPHNSNTYRNKTT